MFTNMLAAGADLLSMLPMLLIIGVTFAETFLKMTDCPETLLPKATVYFKLYFVACPVLYFYNFCNFAKFAITFFVPTLSKATSSKVSLPIGLAERITPVPNVLWVTVSPTE